MECLAIGSLPHDNSGKAIELVNKYFNNIPFWPQLSNISKNEDMTFQFLEGMPSFNYSYDFKFDTDNEIFFENLETFFIDYENIIENKDYDKLEKYAITENYSKTFNDFLELAKNKDYAKGQIVGPFTLATTLKDKDGNSAIYDETLKEIIVKLLSLKALWQIKKIKEQGAKPIIFIDEPTLSQLGTSAYLTVNQEDVVEMLRTISTIIQENGGISAIHCCGKCDWQLPLKAGVNIISFDAYNFAENLSIYDKMIKEFLNNNGKLAFGIVPTLDENELKRITINDLTKKFEEALNYLTKKGISEKLIISNTYITPSCGAGGLSEELAEKAMRLTRELTNILKERYNDN